MTTAVLRTRAATMADSVVVGALQQRLGLVADAPEDWRRIWLENPWRSADIPIGWVLEDAGQIIGYIGNVPLSYDLGGQTIRAVAARGWTVDPRYRGGSLALLMNYWNQKNVDLLLNSSSNEPAFRIFKRIGAHLLPHAVFGDILFWVTNASSFLGAALLRSGLPRPLASAMGRVAGAAWTLKLKIGSRRNDAALARLAQGYDVRVLSPDQIDDAFDRLWHKMVGEKRRFLADRSAPALRWHFSRNPPSVTVIGCYSGGELAGYLAYIRKANAETGFTRHQVIDLVVVNDEPGVTELLLRHARRLSERAGVSVTELIGFPDRVRQQAAAMGAWRRPSFPTPFTFRLVNPALVAGEFADPDLWYPSLYDGDGSL